VCHPFEAAWARGARRRLLRPTGYASMTRADVSSLLSRGAGAVVTADEEAHAERDEDPEESNPWEFERVLGSVRKGGAAAAPPSEQVSARYVSFQGPSYAYLTAVHKVPVANSVVVPHSRHASMPERTVDQIKPDD